MRAIILAAGRGSRLGAMTEALPKGLVELGGKPLLSWQIAALREGGCEQIGIVKGYRSECLDLPETTGFFNPRWQTTQMVKSLVCAADWLREAPCLISYADILTTSVCIQRLIQAPGALVISSNTQWRRLWEARFADPLADAETFRSNGAGCLTEIGQRATALEQIEGQYMGLLKITPLAWGWIEAALEALSQEAADRLDMTSLLQLLLRRQHEISVLPVAEPWLELDTPEDLRLYQDWLVRGELALPLGVH
ncbi:nucleotidyl transferase [bacterium (Candidatus Blackallbacteria) CG17_big_fil_post_rev_8_21_14_2_50_48_46]|uniref:Nucleotidyl transferase n=1 Tax=bacterium (Candidatus Blackallbacteria) CG17_big_fil_post_rev_8_21_14_2_50_48_46 TaxID=2014261 RepID=A0A2M7G9L0_9BACT|nr:MAG: nucleotidyl transferase [bacterium (Candidatus Blackallbacteria) CG18_big_fil_WC_8_21_14_2_50_49_26]PIW18817.1 MAG: nucleotidyl transferase [bacterium (Candidatus Blackallbacteria) CG17_big_fil_post_rev_8_21_14_2_50_48_46]PIW49272.1 MAG: nucleotidyl transferase [bacterium (Candidatus Blackallbacteria) CG13_big_fil_rev_8_21_14_2_50_49_14]